MNWNHQDSHQPFPSHQHPTHPHPFNTYYQNYNQQYPVYGHPTQHPNQFQSNLQNASYLQNTSYLQNASYLQNGQMHPPSNAMNYQQLIQQLYELVSLPESFSNRSTHQYMLVNLNRILSSKAMHLLQHRVPIFHYLFSNLTSGHHLILTMQCLVSAYYLFHNQEKTQINLLFMQKYPFRNSFQLELRKITIINPNFKHKFIKYMGCVWQWFMQEIKAKQYLLLEQYELFYLINHMEMTMEYIQTSKIHRSHNMDRRNTDRQNTDSHSMDRHSKPIDVMSKMLIEKESQQTLKQQQSMKEEMKIFEEEIILLEIVLDQNTALLASIIQEQQELESEEQSDKTGQHPSLSNQTGQHPSFLQRISLIIFHYLCLVDIYPSNQHPSINHEERQKDIINQQLLLIIDIINIPSIFSFYSHQIQLIFSHISKLVNKIQDKLLDVNNMGILDVSFRLVANLFYLERCRHYEQELEWEGIFHNTMDMIELDAKVKKISMMNMQQVLQMCYEDYSSK